MQDTLKNKAKVYEQPLFTVVSLSEDVVTASKDPEVNDSYGDLWD